MPKAEHSHPHAELSQHTHTHTQTKAVLNRLSRAIGHLESVKRMVENGKDHIEHCLVDAVEHGDQTSIDHLNRAIEQFIK